MDNCQIIAYHGWGFGADLWEGWGESLSDIGEFKAVDRGYFDEPRQAEVTNDGRPVVFLSHSLGLHMMDETLFEDGDLLIILGGFLHFHPYAAQYKRRSRFVLQEMINDFEVHPKETLYKFYENCFSPQDSPKEDASGFNHQLLLDDLNALQISEREPDTLHKVDKICILHGSKDRIVSNKKGREIYNQCQQKAQYFELKDAGHALPKTHYKQCMEFILPEIKELL